jgi:REP element-mobilizing transposase RayT
LHFLITFSCYGQRLHGSQKGSVDRLHNAPATPVIAADSHRAGHERERMAGPPYLLDGLRRDAVIAAIREVCVHRDWNLIAAHARRTHVHAVVEARTDPERILTAFKCYSSRRLNDIGCDQEGCRRWARHGSTRWLKEADSVSAAIRYVVDEQGERLTSFKYCGL